MNKENKIQKAKKEKKDKRKKKDIALLSETSYINKALVISHSIAVGLGLLSFLSSKIGAELDIIKDGLWIFSCVAPYIVCITVYFRNRDSKNVQYYMAFGYMIFYLYSMISETQFIYTYVYIFPVLIILIACNNIKLIYAMGGLTIAVNIYDAITSWSIVSTAENLARVAMVGICAAYAVLAAQVSSTLANRKLAQIENEKNVTDEIMLNMSDSIDGLNSNKQMLSDAITSTTSVVAGINAGMHDAVNSIQQQLTATENIQNLVGEARTQVVSMGRLVDKTDGSIREGSAQINALSQSTDILKAKNETILNEVNELEQKATEVKEIVGIINGIASQTKLLSLNASIEAARAGNYGRGFAVVAQEIGSLSNQTGNFITQITGIIDTLSNEIASMKSAVDDMMTANELQNDVIGKVASSFESISGCMGEVTSDMSSLALHIENVSTHTTNIVSDAATVSEVSEKVLVSTGEADSICEKNVEIVNTISEIANLLQNGADNLKSRRR